MVDEHGIPLGLYAVRPLLNAGCPDARIESLIRAWSEGSRSLPPAALYLLRDLAASIG